VKSGVVKLVRGCSTNAASSCEQRSESFDRINPLPFIVGCFNPAKTIAYSTLEVSSERPRLVLTYPVRCAGGIT